MLSCLRRFNEAGFEKYSIKTGPKHVLLVLSCYYVVRFRYMLVSKDETRIEWKTGERDLMTFSYVLREEVLNHMIGNQVDF